MNKKYLQASIMLALLGAGFFLVKHFHITTEIAYKLPRIIAREAYYRWIVREDAQLDKMPYSIPGELVTLKKLEFQDFEFYYPMIGNPYCADTFFINTSINLVPEIDPNFYLYIQKVTQFFGSRSMYSVIDNASGKIGGMVEIMYIRDANTGKKDHYEICGFARPREWGNGKAMEATALAIESFFTTTSETELIAYTAPHNSRCHTFLLKCGFIFCKVCEEEHSKNELVFKILKENGLVITQVVRALLRHQQAKKNYSESPSRVNHLE